ncbi:DUF1349 domain-containing protein [Xenorhabdus szentirmaii]|uniref:Regulation of enolase protein 1 n=2 Tax=Xenorhabdus szentirmaii TaxID=290112 RepID=W1IX27_9GAMM|nr:MULTISPECIES: DUF1349 domain-containing protein [Xenorhabdus]MBD2802369.1 DUF1349 domain-containing protein [Xenorhabdus sp. M]MBD2804433.1 DUF1349 domain-containing protein [Xenorhabdus sp. ZM]MBD2825470.1 DUF1349 domain-containing protein [Xenorhabdus sp. 5]PHM34771.1 hypothetical protein Xsze_01206 [Xenorhabdus szentirmaii DSM 16338]CDL82994.1 conserved hypothetical protein [Xenorhabdus szentirmaii DSM 16338]
MNLQECQWLNEPAVWRCQENELYVSTDNKTNFWRDTWYGFQRHSGHVFGGYTGDFQLQDGFTFQCCIEGQFEHLYDQAGIMLLVDEQHWLKAGIEHSDGRATIDSVLTNGGSDWAMGIFPGEPDKFWLRLTYRDNAIRLQYSVDGVTWPLLRLSPFVVSDQRRIFIGAMCCSPEREGLQVKFSDFRLTPSLNKHLHDLS